jgi:VWFA-related protein
VGHRFGSSGKFQRMAAVWALCASATVAGFRLTLPAQTLPTQQSSNGAAKPSGAQATIKTNVRQVLIDVVVTDRHEHSIKRLRQDDFTVFEDGVRQKIVAFEAHTASPGPSYLKALAAAPPPPDTFRNTPLGNDNLPLNVLLYDLLNTPIDDQPYAHDEVVRFLQNRPVGSRFAIFVLSDKLHMLQGFTDDEQLLIAAMHGKKTAPYTSAANQWVGNFPSLAQLSGSGSGSLSDRAMAPILARMEVAESRERAFYLNIRIQETLNALLEIAKFLNGMPGRKNLIWLSGSFPVQVFSEKSALNPFGSSVNYSEQLHQTAGLFSVGQVAVYPVDARGLPSYFDGTGVRSASVIAEEIYSEHEVMREIADDTGGHAFYSTNGLADAIAASIDDGANYYSLSYSPTDTNFNGHVRKIRIKVSPNAFHLAYRHSYVADDEAVLAQKVAKAPSQRLENTEIRGAPLSHELVFEAQIHPEGAPAKLAEDGIPHLAQFPSFAGRTTWDDVQMQIYRIDYTVVGGRITFGSLADGSRSGRFQFQYTAFDSDNRAMVGNWADVRKTFTLEEFSAISKGGYHFRQEVAVPTGAAWLRLIVRDAIGDHIGSIEIPLPQPPEAQPKATNTN